MHNIPCAHEQYQFIGSMLRWLSQDFVTHLHVFYPFATQMLKLCCWYCVCCCHITFDDLAFLLSVELEVSLS